MTELLFDKRQTTAFPERTASCCEIVACRSSQTQSQSGEEAGENNKSQLYKLAAVSVKFVWTAHSITAHDEKCFVVM